MDNSSSSPVRMPLLGFGTWRLWGDGCYRAVSKALEVGYRHIDTAFAYENHAEIAKAVHPYPREEIFLTSKISLGRVTQDLTLNQIDPKRISASVNETCEKALQELKTDYLDLLLIHWPSETQPLNEILAAMHEQIKKGKLRYVGVSNYTIHHLQEAYDAGLAVHYNQVEFHPHLYQKELLDFARAHGTELIAYRPLGAGKILKEEPKLKEIGKQHGMTTAQVILCWLIQKKIPSIPKASSEKHIKQNFSSQNYLLPDEDISQIDQLNKNFRYCNPEWNEFDY